MENFVSSYYKTNEKRRLGINNIRQFSNNSKEVFNEIWEIHDRITGRVYVVTPDYNQFLRNEVDAIQAAGMPFIAVDFVKHPRTFWVTPQAYYLLQIQATQFDIAKQAEKQRRLNVTRFLCDESAIGDDEMNKLISGDVGAVAKVKGNRNLKDVFVAFPQQSNFPLIEHAEYTRKDARDAVGMSRNQLGEFDKGTRRTAQEASIVQAGSQNRSQRRVDAMTDLYVKTIRKVTALAKRFWTQTKTIQIQDNWVFFTGDMLEGEFNYDIHLSTKRHESMTDRRLEAIQLLANLSQLPGANIPALQENVVKAANDPAYASFFVQQAQQQNAGQAATSATQGAANAVNQDTGGV